MLIAAIFKHLFQVISLVSIGAHFHGEEQRIQSATGEIQRKALALYVFSHPGHTGIHRGGTEHWNMVEDRNRCPVKGAILLPVSYVPLSFFSFCWDQNL